MASSLVIDVQGLTKSFGSLEAVRDISFSVAQGERLAYIGPNGAGKSTSIKILTGILHPTSGTAHVLGLVPWQQRKALARRIGVLFGQRSQLWAELSPRQSLRLLGTIYSLDSGSLSRRIDQVAELLDAVELLDQPVRTQSLGQRMRCELAASVLHQPEVLFLDEPTIGLDLLAKQRFRELLVRLSNENGTNIFLTSHDVADIEAVAQRVIVINHGTVIYDDQVDKLRRSFLSTKLVEVRFEHEPVPFPVLPGVEVTALSSLSYELKVDTQRNSIRGVLDTLLDQCAVADISVTDPALEDVIAELYKVKH